MPYRTAREFAALLFSDEGRDTLTVRNGKRALTRMLMSADRLDHITAGHGDDEKEAAALVNDLLLSPVLRDVLCKPTNFSIRNGTPPSSIVAKLDRAVLGEHDARILRTLLISQCKAQIIIPDFGFYARDFHTSLIREGRLIAGVHTLSELPETLRHMCLLMEKIGRQCTWDDAQTLARYTGLTPHTVGYDAFIDAVMR